MGTGSSRVNVGNTIGSHDDGGEDIDLMGNSRNSIPSNESQLRHMFGEREGHLLDTFENRTLIHGLVNDPSCKLGIDSWGNEWYARTNDNGEQIWATARNGVVQNCGINETPRSFNPITGLSAAEKPKNNGFRKKRG